MIPATRKCPGFQVDDEKLLRDYLMRDVGEKGIYADQVEDAILLANDFVTMLSKAEKCDIELFGKLWAITSPYWSESLAELILSQLEETVHKFVEGEIAVGTALEASITKSVTSASNFPQDVSGYQTIIAIGALVLIAPWVLETLGFGELGPIEGIQCSIATVKPS